MSVKVLSWVFDHSKTQWGERLVALALADAADDLGRCWPSIACLAAKANVSQATVKRATAAMVQMGELVITDRGQQTNVYQFTCRLNLSPQQGQVVGSQMSPQDEAADTVVSSSCTVVSSNGAGCELTGEPRNRKEPSENRQRRSTSLASLAQHQRDGFDRFWTAYPRHEGKQAAMKAWRKLGPDPPLAAILAALAWQCQLARWVNEPEFIPHPATYLNGRRWEDERPARTAPLTQNAASIAAFLASFDERRTDDPGRTQDPRPLALPPR